MNILSSNKTLMLILFIGIIISAYIDGYFFLTRSIYIFIGFGLLCKIIPAFMERGFNRYKAGILVTIVFFIAGLFCELNENYISGKEVLNSTEMYLPMLYGVFEYLVSFDLSSFTSYRSDLIESQDFVLFAYSLFLYLLSIFSMFMTRIKKKDQDY